jgi:hypothetical protein
MYMFFDNFRGQYAANKRRIRGYDAERLAKLKELSLKTLHSATMDKPAIYKMIRKGYDAERIIHLCTVSITLGIFLLLWKTGFISYSGKHIGNTFDGDLLKRNIIIMTVLLAIAIISSAALTKRFCAYWNIYFDWYLYNIPEGMDAFTAIDKVKEYTEDALFINIDAKANQNKEE